MDRFNLSAWGLRNGALTLFAMLVLAAAGAVAYLQLGRAEDPSFTLKSMVVSAAWPGATAEETQALVADRIESRLQDLRSLDVLRTYVRPGVAVVTVVLRDDTPPRDVPGLWYEVRKKVGDIRPLLPAGVVGPSFNDEYSDVFSVVLALTGTDDNAELVRQAEAIRLRLLRLPGVEKVAIGGERPQRVFVEASHARLATLGIPPTALLDALARRNPLAPAGTVEGGPTRLALRVDAGLDGLAAIRATPVAAPDGRTLRLADVAEVRRGFEDPPQSRVLHRGQEAVTVSVAKRAGWDVTRLGADVARELAAIRAALPAGLALEGVSDQAHVVRESIAEFLLKFAAALGVVMLVSFATLGVRAGLVVALSVPLTLAATFLLMREWGMELERISLGALILALGLLVDDAIIATEAMVVKLEHGWERAQAAAWAWGHTAAPMLVGTLITAAGFIPVGFARSVAGEYAGGIFWVVGAALVASWLVAVWFIPYLGAKLLSSPRGNHAGGDHGGGEEGRAARALRRAVRWSVRRRAPVLLAAVALLGAGGAGMAFTRKQFFPSSQRLELLVDVGLRGGAPLPATEAAVREVERFLDGEGPDAALRTAYLGAGAPRFFLALDPDLPNEADTKIVIQTPSEAARERLRARLMEWAASGAVPEARVRVSRLDFGPPVGFPVQFRVAGPDLAALRPAADAVLAALRATPGTRDAQIQGGERAPALRVALDQERVAQLGLSPEAVSRSLAILLAGAPATQLREGTRLVDVVLRAPDGQRLAAASLGDLSVWTAAGPVPLAQVARLVPVTEEPIVWRRSREPHLTVRADVLDGLQGPDVTAAALPRVAAVRAGLPEGVRIETGGAVEESGKANAALYALFPLMVAAMWVLLMAQLRHWGRAALVFATAPLGVPGAAAALLLLDRPFGFVALLGVIALAGMVMRNTLILVDQVRQDLEEGIGLEEAIVGSTVRRARPVLLTALAAVLAFVPLTHSAFWGPMAVAMTGGLFVATAATLLVVPALYALALPRQDAAPRSARSAAPAVPGVAPPPAAPARHPVPAE